MFLSLIFTIFAQDISVPTAIKAEIGQFVTITAQTKGEIVQFYAIDPGLAVFPANLLVDKKSTVVTAQKNGVYRVLAYTSIDNKPTAPVLTSIVIGGEPNPLPPDDNRPKPPAPPLTDELTDKIKSVYGADQSPTKEKHKKTLHNGLVVVYNKIDKFNTVFDLYNSIKTDVTAFLPADQLLAVREVIGTQLETWFGTNPATILNKTNAKEKLNKIIKILESL